MLLALACCVHLLYVAGDSTIGVYDIDHEQRLLRTIHVAGAGEFTGIGASEPLGLLFLASHRRDELIAIRLADDGVAWRRTLPPGPRCFAVIDGRRRCGFVDSFALSPDGLRLYVPMRREDDWDVVDAAGGRLLGRIRVTHGSGSTKLPVIGVGPHNTAVAGDGRIYMEVLTDPWVYVADARTLRVVGRIGPFAGSVRPFAVDPGATHIYANVEGILGFQVAKLAGGRRTLTMRTARAQVPAERLRQIGGVAPEDQPHGTPSHGIALAPGGRELWVADGVYGYLHAFDVSGDVPRQVASVPLFTSPGERPDAGWVSIGRDGRYVYADDGSVVDARARRVVARVAPGRAVEVER